MTSSGRAELPQHYKSVDGSDVSIPRLRQLSETAPVFTDADVPWIADAFARAKTDLAKYRKQVADGANPVFAARLPLAEAALSDAEERFGTNGERFLGALNAGDVWKDFWRAMFCVFGLRAQRPTRIEGEVQEHILALLVRLPPGLRQNILAQAFFPAMRKPRKWEGFHAMVIEELGRPEADLRNWEVGADKITSIEEMPDETLFEIARSFGARTGQFAQFKQHAADRDPVKSPLHIKGGNSPEHLPVDRAEALAILEDFPVESSYGPRGMVKSEANLRLTQSFHATMLKLRPGIPQGHLVHLALSTKPYGPTWPRVNFDEFPRDVVWPYIASHLDIIARALSGTRLPWEPMMEPLKALKTLSLLPALPESVADSVAALAKSNSAAQRKAAKSLLKP